MISIAAFQLKHLCASQSITTTATATVTATTATTAMALYRHAGRQTAAVQGIITLAKRNKHTLPDLAYDYNALEPVIDAEIMQIHHSKHHQAYVNNLNVAEEKLEKAISHHSTSNKIALQSAYKFNGGGHINHTIFWTNLTPPKHFTPPEGEILKAIEKDFGSLNSMIEKFNAQTAAVQGSGWGWLGLNKETKAIQIATTFNQDPLEATTGLIPLLGVDVWEHAYYLQYKNARPDYLKAIWEIVNWKNVAERYRAAKQ